MNEIYLLLFASFFIKFSLSSNNITIEITGKAEIIGEPCNINSKLFYFYIPFIFPEGNSEDSASLVFNIELKSPQGKMATCKYETSQNRKLSLEESLYLECSLDVSSFVLYEDIIELDSNYDSSVFENLHVIGWEQKIGSDPIVSKKASCPNPTYIMKNIAMDYNSDICYGNYHSLTLNGQLTLNSQTNDYVTSSNDFNFEMIINLSSLVKKARCKLIIENGKLECTFEGDGTITSSRQLILLNGEYLYLEAIDSGVLRYHCNKYSLLDISFDYEECQNKTHYLNLNGNLAIKDEIIPSLSLSYIPHFEIEVNINSRIKKVNCKLLEMNRNGKNGLLECSFKENGNFQFFEQNIMINDDYLYIPSFPTYSTKKCSTSWLSLNLILLFTLILI